MQLLRIGVVVAIALLAPSTGQAGGAADLEWSPTTGTGTFDLGAVEYAHRKSQTFVLTNTGGSATGALSITLSGRKTFAITSNGCRRSLGKGKSCAVTVRYVALSSGRRELSTLAATGAKQHSAGASLTLAAIGSGDAPDLTLTPGGPDGPTTPAVVSVYYYFGPTQTQTTQTFTIANDGTAQTHVDPFDLVSDPVGAFTIVNDDCSGAVIDPGAHCTFAVVYTPAPSAPPGLPPPEAQTYIFVDGVPDQPYFGFGVSP